jgi:hypothetical protein
MNPRFTAEKILGVKNPEPSVIVREFGFANIAIWTAAVGSLYAPSWLTAAAVAGAIFYGLAGANHLVRTSRNRMENVAMLSDLLLCGVLCAYCFGAAR